ncbi:MAG: hypothetical protein KAW17_05150 [Candidatus Eisenbacteria sp.]|nr:hypothetical protein [Candidatus Eisenbacteria bacterium]
MKSKAYPLTMAIVVLAALACLSGCYTVLKHPRQVSMTDEHGARRSCSDCHDQAQYYHDPFMYRYYDRHSYHNQWYGYYNDPWWYDNYWYYDSWEGESPALQKTGRTRWGGDPARPKPPERGATTNIGSPGSGDIQPKNNSGGGSSGSGSSSSVDKEKRTRWGSKPDRPKPPPSGSGGAQKTEEGKKAEPKKQADEPKK